MIRHIGKVYLLCLVLGCLAHADQVNCIKWKDIAGETVGTYCKPFQVRAGNGIQFADDGYGKITVSATGVAAGAGGSDTQINFNSSGALAGSSGLTWNNSTSTLTATHITGLSNKPYIDMVRDCGAVGNGVTDDGPAIQACLDLYPGRGFFFPQTIAHNCSYFSGQTLYPKGSGVQILGQSGSQYLDDTTAGHMGGTEICFPTGITGFWLEIQSPTSSQGGAIRNIALRGTAGFTSLITPTGINVPGSMPHYTHNITTIQRSSNVLTVVTSPINSVEGLAFQVGSQVLISGVVGDATMNGRCIVATLTASGGSTDNPWGFTCAQNGSDAGAFGAVGTISLPSTGASSADGIRVCSNFWTIEHVGIIKFERHGINADSTAGSGCPLPFSDDLVLHEVMSMENGGDGFLCKGTDCNAGFMSGNTFYYNFSYGIEDQSTTGNTWIGNNISNNGSQWATTAVPTTKAISTIARTLTSGVSTVTVVLSVADANLKLGSCVVIAGVTDSSFNSTSGQCYFLTAYTDSKNFQYEQPGAPADASSSGGTSRMAKFSEAYLSSGVDSGGLKIGTQTAVWSTALYSNYLEGGQNCKYGPSVLVMPGATQLACVVNDAWRGVWITSNGSTPHPSTNISNFQNDTDNNLTMQYKSGRTADQNTYFNWLDHSNTIKWQIFEQPSQWAVYRGGGALKLELKDTTTRLNGGTTSLEINNDATAAGLVKFFSGTPTPALVGTVDATGLGTFNGGVKAGSSGSTIADSRELLQNVHLCGTTTTCANTANGSYRMIFGNVTLSTGAAVVSSITAFTSNTSYVCTGTDKTAVAAVQIVNTSTSSITINGTGSDSIDYVCVGK